MNLTIADLDVFKAKPVSAAYSPTMRTFFAPQDNVHDALKKVITRAQHSIVVALYGFNDDDLAAMLDAALKDPTMFVQISLDKSQAGGVHERAILAKYSHEMTGNSVAIGTSERGQIMHRKMVIVDGIWRISGSTNWGTSAETLQDNECTILLDPVACAEARTILDIEHDHMLAAMSKAKAATSAA